MGRPRKGHEKWAGNRVSFRISDETRAGLDRLALANGRPIADEARAALDEYVQRNGGQAQVSRRVEQDVPPAPLDRPTRVFKR